MVVSWMMKTLREVLLSLFILAVLVAARSDAPPSEENLRMKFDDNEDEANHFCGDAHLCSNKYPIWTNISVSDPENKSWNATAVISPNRMNDIQYVFNHTISLMLNTFR